MLGIDFKDLKVMQMVLSVSVVPKCCPMPHTAAGCQELARADVRETQLMACKLQRLPAACGNN